MLWVLMQHFMGICLCSTAGTYTGVEYTELYYNKKKR